MKKLFIIISIFFLFLVEITAQCTFCYNTTNTGTYSSTLGRETVSEGESSFASGLRSQANADFTTALGYYAFATYTKSMAFGSMVKANMDKSIVIGSGFKNENIYLENNVPRSLMIGFTSKYPTFFVAEPNEQNVTYTKTGRIAIGNVINQDGYMDPQAKLHIRADDGEEAAIFIEPNNWNAGEEAKIILGDTNHFIRTSKNTGIEFNSLSDFVFKGNNIGFGVAEPKAKVHINGDLLFEHNLNGIIMKSEDGNCWKGTISNNGELIFSQIDCETLSSTENNTETKHSEIFIYPNPTNRQITVEYTGNKKNLRLEIKSISGLLVATYKINKGENRIELNNISDQIIVASVFTRKGELVSTNKVVIKNK